MSLLACLALPPYQPNNPPATPPRNPPTHYGVLHCTPCTLRRSVDLFLPRPIPPLLPLLPFPFENTASTTFSSQPQQHTTYLTWGILTFSILPPSLTSPSTPINHHQPSQLIHPAHSSCATYAAIASFATRLIATLRVKQRVIFSFCLLPPLSPSLHTSHVARHHHITFAIARRRLIARFLLPHETRLVSSTRSQRYDGRRGEALPCPCYCC